MTSATSPLPTHMGVVMAKVLRLENDKCTKRRSRLRRKMDIEYCDSGKLAPAPTQVNKSEMLKTRREAPPAQQAPAQRTRESANPPPQKASAAPSPPPASSSPAPVVKPPAASPAPVAPAPAPTPSPPPPPPEPVLNREELAAKRQALVQEQVDAALTEKREVYHCH
jgi:hypothetical protein